MSNSDTASHGARLDLQRNKPSSISVTAAFSLALTASTSCHGQIQTDGLVGPEAALIGPDYLIPNSLGIQVGPNLFHSFSSFDIATGESATFTSSFNGVTDNVISRVTGGSASTISGVLRNTIPSADFWLVNPAGVIFGSGAELEMTASFYVTSSDFVELGDCAAASPTCGRFDAANPAESLLTVAAPSAFGFLDDPVGQISVTGSEVNPVTLAVPIGETLSLVGKLSTAEPGGSVSAGLANTQFEAPEGRIDLTSVQTVTSGNTGLVNLPEGPAEPPVIQGFDESGAIGLSNSDLLTSGSAGGRIFLRGDEIVMDGSSINANGSAAGDAGLVDIEASSFRMVTTTPADTEGSAILVETDALGATGDAGTAIVRAQVIELRDGARVEAATRDGAGGSIALYGQDITVSESVVRAGTAGLGAGGTVTVGGYASTASDLIPADLLTVSGNDGDTSNDLPTGNPLEPFRPRRPGTIRADSFNFGNTGLPGEIRVVSRSIRLEQGGTLFAFNRDGSDGTGGRGLIEVQVDDLYLEGGIATQTFGNGFGSDLVIRGLGYELTPASTISMPGLDDTGFFSYIQAGSSSNDPLLGNRGGGRPGDISISANSITMGSEAQITNGINAFGTASGSGFRIEIDAQSLLMRDGAFISSNTSGEASAGIVELDVDSLILSGPGSRIEATSKGQGAAGDITIRGFETVIDAGLISTTAFGSGRGGSIAVETDRLSLLNGGSIDTSSRPELLSLLPVSSFDDFQEYDVNREPDLSYNSDSGNGALNAGEVQSIAFGGETIDQPSQFIAAFDVLEGANTEPVDLIARSSFETVDDGSPLPGSGSGPLVRGVADRNEPVQLDITGFPDFGGYPFFEFEGDHTQAGDYAVLVQLRPITTLPRAGDGGAITLRGRSSNAVGAVTISGDGSGLFSISAGDPETSGAVALAGAGDAGSIDLQTASLRLTEGGQISVQSVGTGRAGSVDITATNVELIDALVSAEAPRALAGNVIMDVTDRLRLVSSTISGESAAADAAGGNFFIANAPADRSILDQPDFNPETDVQPMRALVLADNSRINASSAAAGSGNIVISAEAIAISADSEVSATGEVFTVGQVLVDVAQIDAPELVDASDGLQTRCTPTEIENRSSLLVDSLPAGAVRSPYLDAKQTMPAASAALTCAD